MAQMPNPATPPSFGGKIRLQDKDKSALQELSKHINYTIEILEVYGKKGASQEQVSGAFRRIFSDAVSANRLEKHLASYIINELKMIKLKAKTKGEFFTVFSFLEAYWNGSIKDEKTVQMGFNGLAGPAVLAVLRNCKTELIMKEYI